MICCLQAEDQGNLVVSSSLSAKSLKIKKMMLLFHNMETYITICKTDSQWEFAVWLRKLKQGLCINLEGWDGEGDGKEFQKGGDICIQKKRVISSVAQSCPTLCDPINRSTPGLPVHHQLPESTQTHVH